MRLYCNHEEEAASISDEEMVDGDANIYDEEMVDANIDDEDGEIVDANIDDEHMVDANIYDEKMVNFEEWDGELGKTLAFGIPALVHVLCKKKLGDLGRACPSCSVLSSTRELAQQMLSSVYSDLDEFEGFVGNDENDWEDLGWKVFLWIEL
ncbi:hypothetical protein Sjap_022067 [Stephania japonica]|uniref:Uncharacterized protein n=1 Tax=Stephania japonica TaxID=461633 RepID=A0AAP0HUP4_9MAGN